ncbi:hypothetical protein WDU94_009371 [Cyamophila willieti]
MAPGVGFIVGGASLLIFGIWFGWFGFKGILKSQIGKQVRLVEGTEMRTVWSKLPIPLYDDFFFFNVTNPAGVYKGEKPKLQQVGPFCVDEWMEKVGIIDDEKTDSVAYHFKSTYYFNSERSKGLTGDEEIVLPHFILLGMLLQTARDTPAGLGFIDKAIDPIFNGQKSLYLKTTPNQILFDGILLNCTSKKVAAKAVCAILQAKGAEMGVQKAGDNIYKVSVFGVPMIFTSPHFYEGSEKYLSRVEGLNPNKEDHGIYMDMEPMTGASFDVRLRIQFNMFMYEMKKIEVTRNLTSTPILHPLFWLQSSVEVTDEIVKPIKMLYTVMSFVKILKYLLIIGGFALMGFGGYTMFLANQNKVKDVVQNTVKKMDFNGQSSDEKNNKMDPSEPNAKY